MAIPSSSLSCASARGRSVISLRSSSNRCVRLLEERPRPRSRRVEELRGVEERPLDIPKRALPLLLRASRCHVLFEREPLMARRTTGERREEQPVDALIRTDPVQHDAEAPRRHALVPRLERAVRARAAFGVFAVEEEKHLEDRALELVSSLGLIDAKTPDELRFRLIDVAADALRVPLRLRLLEACRAKNGAREHLGFYGTDWNRREEVVALA